MFLFNLIIFLLSYIVSCYILYFITSKLNLKKYFVKNIKRQIIALIMCIILCSFGNLLIDKFIITGYCHIILKALLLSVIPITLCVIDLNSSKNKKTYS